MFTKIFYKLNFHSSFFILTTVLCCNCEKYNVTVHLQFCHAAAVWPQLHNDNVTISPKIPS